jgi:hypothetical protein
VSGEGKVDKFEKDARLLATEELLVSGIGSARVERELARRFGVGVRQVRRYIADVRSRWAEESKRDSAFRREKLIRMAERLYAKAYAADRFGPANSALQTLARLGGAFASDPSDRIRNIEVILGPPPTGDPLKAMEYAQGVLLLSMQDVASDPSLDPERRWRLLADMAAKVGMTFSRAQVQADIDKVKRRLGIVAAPGDKALALTGVSKPATARRPKLTPVP